MVHAIFTKDESIWKDFEGDVPRVGDAIEFIGDDTKYEVESVRWFIVDNYKGNPELANTESAARVLIKTATSQS